MDLHASSWIFMDLHGVDWFSVSVPNVQVDLDLRNFRNQNDIFQMGQLVLVVVELHLIASYSVRGRP